MSITKTREVFSLPNVHYAENDDLRIASKKFFMRIIKKPFLINMPLFSIVRIDHNKFFFPLLAIVWRLSTHGANGEHTWCGGLTPFVRIAYSHANNVGLLKQKGLLRCYSLIISRAIAHKLIKHWKIYR